VPVVSGRDRPHHVGVPVVQAGALRRAELPADPRVAGHESCNPQHHRRRIDTDVAGDVVVERGSGRGARSAPDVDDVVRRVERGELGRELERPAPSGRHRQRGDHSERAGEAGMVRVVIGDVYVGHASDLDT
jgi:hypothetical protein